MAANLTPTGSTNGSNVYNFATARAAATVVDGILNYPAFASMMLKNGVQFSGDGRGEQPTIIKTVKVAPRTQFQWFDGLDGLNSSAENVVAQLQFNDSHATNPMVEIMTESFARQGEGEDIDYPAFEYQDVLNSTVDGLSQAFFGVGGGEQSLGLEAIIDDGTNLATYGGQSRSTYTSLKSTVTASSGSMTLAKLATLRRAISDVSPTERPTQIYTTDTIAGLYEQFLTPTVVNNSYASMDMSGQFPTAGKLPSMGQGFGGVNTYSGIPLIADKAATSGVLYMANTNYLKWHGRTKVPASFKEFVSPVSMGKKSVIEGQVSDNPSNYHGFFYQAKQPMQGAAAIISRFYVFGQLVSFQPRRQGKLTGITTIA